MAGDRSRGARSGPGRPGGLAQGGYPHQFPGQATADMLRLGPEAEVLEPEDLRRRVAESIAGMARVYG